MFIAYVDESGIHADAEMFALAGYLAPIKEWDRFVPKWQDVLNRHGVSVFHANQCNGNRGEFKQFEGNREERNAFVKELLSTIAGRRRILAFNVGLAIGEFPDEAHKRVLPVAGHPYYVCMKSVLAQIHLAMDRLFHSSEPVACVFDRQDQFSGRARALFDEVLAEPWDGQNRFMNIAFESMDTTIPLQAADAIAFDSYHEFHRRYYHPERKPRPSYSVLTTNLIARPELIWDQTAAHEMVHSHSERFVAGQLGGR